MHVLFTYMSNAILLPGFPSESPPAPQSHSFPPASMRKLPHPPILLPIEHCSNSF